jgi:hypothetical protein
VSHASSLRTAQVHAQIVSQLREKFGWFGKEKTQRKLIARLLGNPPSRSSPCSCSDTTAGEFQQIQKKSFLPMEDFPDFEQFRNTLSAMDISK